MRPPAVFAAFFRTVFFFTATFLDCFICLVPTLLLLDSSLDGESFSSFVWPSGWSFCLIVGMVKLLHPERRRCWQFNTQDGRHPPSTPSTTNMLPSCAPCSACTGMYSQHSPTHTLGCLECDLTSFCFEYHNISAWWCGGTVRSRLLMLSLESDSVTLCVDYSLLFWWLVWPCQLPETALT